MLTGTLFDNPARDYVEQLLEMLSSHTQPKSRLELHGTDAAAPEMHALRSAAQRVMLCLNKAAYSATASSQLVGHLLYVLARAGVRVPHPQTPWAIALQLLPPCGIASFYEEALSRLFSEKLQAFTTQLGNHSYDDQGHAAVLGNQAAFHIRFLLSNTPESSARRSYFTARVVRNLEFPADISLQDEALYLHLIAIKAANEAVQQFQRANSSSQAAAFA